MNQPRRLFLFLIIGTLVGYFWWRLDHRDVTRAPEKFTPVEAPKLNLEDVKVLAAIDSEYTKLIESVVPSVVSITSSRTVLQQVPLTIEDLLLGRQRAQKAKSTSLGSGVIVSKEGHIISNHHVIAGMTEIRAQLPDGRNVAARLIGSDPTTDIAVLKIEEKNIEALPLGDSDDLRVGQQIFAIGNPYGLDETVTRGVVSAKGRRTANDSGVEVLQHDAAVNPGNSGGPLVNIRGQIVGINSSIYSRTGGFQGISFAIPANTVRRVMDAIISRGRAVRGWLGVGLQAVTPRLAQSFGVPDTRGAIITEIMRGSPAELAGLQPGDVLRKFNGNDVGDVMSLRKQIAGLEIGAKVEVVIMRGGREAKTTLEVVEVPPELLQPER
jgi:serine protease Do